MDYERLSEGPCPIGRGLDRIGDSWSMLILREAGSGRTRFDQFQKHLGIAPNILTRRLSALTAAGLLERRLYSERPRRYEYLLTESGRDFLPVLYALGAWGGRYFGKGGVSRLVTATDGKPVEPIVVDRATGRPITDLDLRIVVPCVTPPLAGRGEREEHT
jgi:DNA-binding HxlR family transcriptional regulator